MRIDHTRMRIAINSRSTTVDYGRIYTVLGNGWRAAPAENPGAAWVADRTDEGPSLYLPGDGVGSLLYVYSVGHSAPPRDEHDGGQRSCWNGQRRDPQPILQSEEVSDSA